MAAENEGLARLLRDTAAADSRAFRRLYDETSPRLYALALKLTRSATAAEDVLQEAFVQVWHRAADYHAQRGSVMAWLSSIVRYRAIDMLRKRRNDEPLDQSAIDSAAAELGRVEPGADNPISTAIATEDSAYLQECLSRLSNSQQQSIALAFFHGLTHRELAERLLLPLGTIKSRLRRSLQKLKECLGNLGYSDEISSGTG